MTIFSRFWKNHPKTGAGKRVKTSIFVIISIKIIVVILKYNIDNQMFIKNIKKSSDKWTAI